MEDINRLRQNNETIENHIASFKCGGKELIDSLIKLVEQASEKFQINAEKSKSLKEERVKKYRKAKAEKLQSVLQRIQEMLDPKWKDFALKLWWYSSSGWSRYREFPEDAYNPKFESPLVRRIDLLTAVANAPARGSQKKIIRIADAIDKVFEPIFDRGFHDFSFLSDDKMEKPFEAFLRESLNGRYNVEDFVLSLTEEDIEELDINGPLMALACKLSGDKLRFWRPPSCFAGSVIACANLEEPLSTDETFAKVLWSLNVVECYTSFEENCERTFQRTMWSFKSVRQSILRYVRDPATVSYMYSPDHRNPEWLRVKKEEVEKVWVDKDIIMQFMQSDVDFQRLRTDQAANAETRWLGGQW
eukprot:CAMPEP_0116833806 /NCGR_PEP_ID=MMETSP0418-20121206/6643_1 /TAXON_ID=1158023 /ORGANISM="Astrosyne radiata, Strain 13vi08-1A" /LENGTH=359 /DNA_ID=CAMNT_0004463301 /DNA_START=282 /DNA_END=1358 /DNA_ORIENTATION=-